MKISIIIPVYNVARYIQKCLVSVINQTYQNIEILIIDDCGTDNSIQIVESIICNNSDKNIKLIHHPHNKGLSAARNTGIYNSTGDYIFFLDSDDYLYPYSIEHLCNQISIYGNVDFVQGYATSEKDSFKIVESQQTKFINIPNELQQLILRQNIIPVTAWNKLISRNFIISNSLFFKEGIINEDELWCFYLSKYALKAIIANSKPTYFYRDNPNGIMRTINQKAIISWDIILQDLATNIDVKRPMQLQYTIRRIISAIIYYDLDPSKYFTIIKDISNCKKIKTAQYISQLLYQYKHIKLIKILCLRIINYLI